MNDAFGPPRDSTNELPRRPKRLKLLLSGFILCITVAAVGRQVHLAWQSLEGQAPHIEKRLLLAAVGVYLAGWSLLGVPWLLLLNSAGAHWPAWSAWKTYLVSHVGKYVPGKAMVVLIRCHRRPAKTPLRTPILVSVHETLFAMAGAGVAACLCLVGLWFHPTGRAILEARPAVPLGATCVAALFIGVASPLAFGRIHRAIERKYRLDHVDSPDRHAWRTYAESLGASALSWFVQGLSYLLVLAALDRGAFSMYGYVVATAAYAMSVVLGFLSMTPGQFGVREWVLIEMVAPFVPARGVAVFAPLVHRLVTLLTEAAVAAILGLRRRR